MSGSATTLALAGRNHGYEYMDSFKLKFDADDTRVKRERRREKYVC